MTDREARVKELAEWVLAAPYENCSLDCEDKMGAEFIARCIVRATHDSEIVSYPLSEFMQEKGIADREEAESLFLEMFRQANRLMFCFSEDGIWFNAFEAVENKKGKEEKLVGFTLYFFGVLKGEGKVGSR